LKCTGGWCFYNTNERVSNILAQIDECGEPEVPSNGHVHRFGSSAIYRCDPGFRLEPNAAVRNCTGGRWAGHQPACVLHVNVPGEFFMQTSDSWTWAVIGFIGGLVVLVIAMVAIFLISKQRLMLVPFIR
jgi:Sushi repeat (SCR repeat)